MKDFNETETPPPEDVEKSSVRATHAEGLALIHGVLSPNRGAPVLGLYVYSASMHVLRTLAKNRDFRRIKPHLMGTPAILSVRPGISQTELAGYLGCERANAGLQVAECIRQGWVRRVVSKTDRRKYTLHITPAGQRMLAELVPIIAKHEGNLGSPLTRAERTLLKELLAKLIAGRTLS